MVCVRHSLRLGFISFLTICDRHVGRASTASLQPEGKPPVSASNIPTKGKDVPRALTVDEIKFIVEEYKTSAQRSKEAGFDGVEVHGAHGYLIDQFVSSTSC